MNTALSIAVLGASATLIVAILTAYGTKKREHEADWRKLKLEFYKEYIRSLSGMAISRASKEGTERYTDAVNQLYLVAPPNVLRALRNLLKETSYQNSRRTIEKESILLTQLLNALRKDVDPKATNLTGDLDFRILDLPPPDAIRSQQSANLPPNTSLPTHQ